jgi:hypothetical protein
MIGFMSALQFLSNQHRESECGSRENCELIVKIISRLIDHCVGVSETERHLVNLFVCKKTKREIIRRHISECMRGRSQSHFELEGSLLTPPQFTLKND